MACPDEDHRVRVPDWLAPTIEQATTQLLELGEVSFQIWKGSVEAQFERPQGDTDGSLYLKREGATTRGSSSQLIHAGHSDRLRTIVETKLIYAVFELR